MLNNMNNIPRRLRNSVAIAAAATVVAPLDPWDRIEGAMGVVSLKATVPAAAAGDITGSLQVGEGTPVPDFLVSVERTVGGGPQIEDPIYRASGSRGNRIFARFRNSDAANATVITFDVTVANWYPRAERMIAQ